MSDRSLWAARSAALLACAGASSVAWGHPGHAELDSLWHAAIHPWTGIDHLLAAVGAGVVAGVVAGRSGRVVAWGYPAAVMLGAALALLLWPAGWVEVMLGLSLVVVAWAMTRSGHMPGVLVPGAILVFAACHGMAHQWETGAAGTGILSGWVAPLAFTASTAVLVGLGWSLQRLGQWARPARWVLALPMGATGLVMVARTLAA